MEELIERALLALANPLGVPASPGLRADAYFPPPGASQFEVSRRSADRVPLPAPFAIWVNGIGTKDPRTCGAGCAKGWIILLETIPDPELRAQIEDRVRQVQMPACVCECNGQIIE